MADVLEEHLDYLSLKGRQQLFEQAFAALVEAGDTVADLGCGFGVLGLLAIDHGADNVWGIDSSNAIEFARETVRRLDLSKRYTCVRGSTFHTRLPNRVDILVCDHVGFLGFDYGIVAMLADARRRMLKSGGKVIPRRIVLQIAGAEGDCREKVDAWTRDPIPPYYDWVRERAVNTKFRYTFEPKDLCSLSATLGAIPLDEDVPDLLSFKARLEIGRDCEFAGLACWFDCELSPGIWMTNSPLAEDRINRPCAFLPCREVFAVKGGAIVEVSIKITHEPVTITWSIQDPSSGQIHRHSTWSGMILPSADLISDASRASQLSPRGRARKAILELAGSKHSLAQIEMVILTDFPDLFPSDAEIRRFVRREFGANVA